ncbi:MAG: hypothetical protein ACKO3G_18320, partial [Planctomycetaceae bacterium]
MARTQRSRPSAGAAPAASKKSSGVPAATTAGKPAPTSQAADAASATEPPRDPAPAPPKRRASAQTLAAGQRDISVSEFFAKNRHLLGFDSPRKALLTSVKEAVDNSLDACEEAGILPEIWVHIEPVGDGGSRFR